MRNPAPRLVTAVIRKCRKEDKDDRPASEQTWCLYTHDGKKLLGRHPSKESAEKQERAIQVRKHGGSVVKYNGAYYVRAIQEVDPGKRIPPPGTVEADAIAAQANIRFLQGFMGKMSGVFDTLIAAPGMEKFEPERKAYDAAMVRADRALSNLDSIVDRLSDKVVEQRETINRFQKALYQLQSERRGAAQQGIEEMSTKETHPKTIKHAGYIYVLAEEDMPEVEELEETEEKEEEEEVDLLENLKKDWQTILDKLPDDLEVDDEFEAALNGIDGFIAEFEKIHEEYVEDEGDEASEEEED